MKLISQAKNFMILNTFDAKQIYIAHGLKTKKELELVFETFRG